MKSIVITGFKRPDLLRQSLSRVFSAKGVTEFKKVLILQRGDSRSKAVVEEFSQLLDTIVETEPSGTSIDSFITNNRMLGYHVGFEFWQSDYVVSIEDDAIIASDALQFIDFIFKQYGRHPSFRGVNLGSKLPYLIENAATYTLTRFGIHGPASMMTRQTWEKLHVSKILKNSNIIFDAQIEFTMKTGFSVVPNCSRYIDLGVQGSHTEGVQGKDYFTQLKASFVNDEHSEINEYFRSDLNQNWREDCRLYKSWQNPYFKIRSYIYLLSYRYPKILKIKEMLRV